MMAITLVLQLTIVVQKFSGSTFTTFCNDPGGYAIYAIGYTNNEYGNTDLIYNNEPTSTYNIKTNPASSSDSNWKMKLFPVENDFAPTIENNYNNYSNIPSNYTKVASYNNVTMNDSDSTTGSSITTSYQATASSIQPAGTYTGAVKYTMVHPGATPAAYFMQDVADWADELPNPGDTFQAVDRRDGKTYWVARLADGNIWMVQNLDLDLSSEKQLTSEDTDLNNTTDAAYQNGYTTDSGIIYWKPINNTVTNINDWISSKVLPSSYDADLASPDSTIGYADGHGLVGNYYNWSAAIASNSGSSRDGLNSICPNGWRLPNVYDKDFGDIFLLYQITQSSNHTSPYINADSYYSLLSAPLWFVRGGSVYNTTIDQAGGTGYYWYGSSYSANTAWRMSFSSTAINAANSTGDKSNGFNIRCLARTED